MSRLGRPGELATCGARAEGVNGGTEGGVNGGTDCGVNMGVETHGKLSDVKQVEA